MRNTHNLCEGVAPLELCVITTPTRTSLHLSILHLFIPKSRRLDVLTIKGLKPPWKSLD